MRKYCEDMEKDFIEKMLSIYKEEAVECYGEDAIVVISEGEAGEYDDNPTIAEYEAKGYRLADANMFGFGESAGEVLTFVPKK